MLDPGSRPPGSPPGPGGLLFLVASIAAPGCGGGAPQPAGTPREVVRGFLRDLDRHDVEGALAHLDDAYSFRSGDGSFSVGKESMPAMLAWDAAAQGEIEVRELTGRGDTVRARLVERNRFTELLELEPWTVEATFVVTDGRIVEEVAREVVDEGPSFTERFERALEPVRRWAVEARPEAARAVFDGGRVARYDGPTARGLLDLIEAYRGRAGAGR